MGCRTEWSRLQHMPAHAKTRSVSGAGGTQHPSVHMRGKARRGTDQTAASTGMYVGWCKWKTEPDPALAAYTSQIQGHPRQGFLESPHLDRTQTLATGEITIHVVLAWILDPFSCRCLCNVQLAQMHMKAWQPAHLGLRRMQYRQLDHPPV